MGVYGDTITPLVHARAGAQTVVVRTLFLCCFAGVALYGETAPPLVLERTIPAGVEIVRDRPTVLEFEFPNQQADARSRPTVVAAGLRGDPASERPGAKPWKEILGEELALGERARQDDHLGVMIVEVRQHGLEQNVFPPEINAVIEYRRLTPVEIGGGRFRIAAAEALVVPAEEHLLPFDQVRNHVLGRPIVTNARPRPVLRRERVERPPQQTVLDFDGVE
jgi:hypothetical protein